MDSQVQSLADEGNVFWTDLTKLWNDRKIKVINFFGKNPLTVNEDVAKIVEWETKIGEITDHEYSSSDR